MHRLGLRDLYENLNTQIHIIETNITKSREYSNDNFTFIENHWSKDILSFNQANLQVTGHHLGRTSYNKFIYFDNLFEYDDENTFGQLTNNVSLNLGKVQDNILSPQYLDWCKTNNYTPHGLNLNLGNIVDLDKNLLKYRQILYRNLNKNQNFSIVLN